MNKTLATIGISTAFAIGGLGFTQMASAQSGGEDLAEDTESTESSTESTESEERSERGERADGEERQGRGNGEGRGKGKGCNKNLDAVAEALGMEADDIKAELEAGSTLAEIAEANNVDPETLVDAMVAAATERVEEKVTEGDLTEEEAAEKLAAKADRIEDKVFGSDDVDSDDA